MIQTNVTKRHKNPMGDFFRKKLTLRVRNASNVNNLRNGKRFFGLSYVFVFRRTITYFQLMYKNIYFQ